MYGEELSEYEEPEAELTAHVKAVVQAIRQGNHVVVYTGAGISTSASIPGTSSSPSSSSSSSSSSSPSLTYKIIEVQKEHGRFEIKGEKEPKKQKSCLKLCLPPLIMLSLIYSILVF